MYNKKQMVFWSPRFILDAPLFTILPYNQARKITGLLLLGGWCDCREITQSFKSIIHDYIIW